VKSDSIGGRIFCRELCEVARIFRVAGVQFAAKEKAPISFRLANAVLCLGRFEIGQFVAAGLGQQLPDFQFSLLQERAAARGCTGVSLTVTAANQPAVSLYQRFGFVVLKQFSAFTRTVR